MKKSLIALLSVVFVISLTACEDGRGECAGEVVDEGTSDVRRTFEKGKDEAEGDDAEKGVNDVKCSVEDATD